MLSQIILDIGVIFMYFKEIDFKSTIVDLQILSELMKNNGFICKSGWDYERMTFDYKFDLEENIYYLRIPTRAFDGDIGSGHAKLEVLTPYLGKHYYPHGIEYDEVFPQIIIGRCEKLLKKLSKSFLHLPKIG